MFYDIKRRNIAHFDLDAFFVSVECLKNSQLAGKPLLVGGQSERAVVAAASYEVRRFGIHSAIPMKLARRLCPQAIIIKGDYESYSNYSRLVTAIIADKVPLYEKASIDEFYIDLTGMDQFLGCRLFTQELRRYIIKESGLPILPIIVTSILVLMPTNNSCLFINGQVKTIKKLLTSLISLKNFWRSVRWVK